MHQTRRAGPYLETTFEGRNPTLGFWRIPGAPRAPWATFGDLLWCSWAAFGELWSDLWSPEARKLACGLHFVQVCEKYTVRVFKNRLGRPSGELPGVTFGGPWGSQTGLRPAFRASLWKIHRKGVQKSTWETLGGPFRCCVLLFSVVWKTSTKCRPQATFSVFVDFLRVQVSNGAQIWGSPWSPKPIFSVFLVPSVKRCSKSKGSLGVRRWIWRHPYGVFLKKLHGAYTRSKFWILAAGFQLSIC